ncbi:CAP domain-containing protein [Microbacteriaceae bacterium 4G12]
MKKTLLLSVAAATALTFGATTNHAKAETIQPNTVTKNYTSPFFVSFQSGNQAQINQLLASLFPNDTFWKSLMSPAPITPPIGNNNGNCNATFKPINNINSGTTSKPTNNTHSSTTSKPTNSTHSGATSKPTNNTNSGATSKPINNTNSGTTSKPINNTNSGTTSKPKNNVTPQPANPGTSVLSAYEQRVVDLTNQERAKYGLPALKVDTTLSKVAKTKSQDMYNLNYFDHTSPTYGSPFDMMTKFGIAYRTAGENIAMGQHTPEEVVQAWMNSAGHRANILNNTYTYIGVGYVTGKDIWTQEFISK